MDRIPQKIVMVMVVNFCVMAALAQEGGEGDDPSVVLAETGLEGMEMVRDVPERVPKAAVGMDGYAVEPAEENWGTILRVQIHLDNQHFGPGIVDGKIGEYTRKAVAFYNLSMGESRTDNWYHVLRESAEVVRDPLTIYTIREEDLQWVDGGLPFKPAEQANRRAMPYRSMLEFVCERYHASEGLLRQVNGDLNLYGLKPGQQVIVPNVNEPFRIESLVAHYEYPPVERMVGNHAIVDTQLKFVMIFRDEELLAAFPITPGEERFIHRGDWKLRNMVVLPYFRYDRGMLDHGVRSSTYHNIPPGPNSPIGVMWNGLNKSGIGLHGTSNPETIGRSRSAGCVRLANWDVVRLPQYLRPGSRVVLK